MEDQEVKKPEITTDDVSQEDVKELTPDEMKQQTIDEYLKSTDYINSINAQKSDAVNKFKSTKMQTEFDKMIADKEEKAKLTPEQLLENDIKEWQGKFEKLKAEGEAKEALAGNKTLALKTLNELKLPVELMDIVMSNDETVLKKNLDDIGKIFNSYKLSVNKSVIESNNIDIPLDKVDKVSALKYPGDNASEEELNAYALALSKK